MTTMTQKQNEIIDKLRRIGAKPDCVAALEAADEIERIMRNFELIKDDRELAIDVIKLSAHCRTCANQYRLRPSYVDSKNPCDNCLLLNLDPTTHPLLWTWLGRLQRY